MPSQQGSDMMNYVKRTRNKQDQEETKKPQVNSESVYVPAKNLTEEEKAREREKRAEQSKKKKSFGRMNINVPKLAELRDHPSLENNNQPRQVISQPQLPPPPPRSTDPQVRQKEIENLFPTENNNQKESPELRKMQLTNRMKSLQAFSADKIQERMRSFLLESVEEIKLIRIKEVTFLPVPEVLDVPGSEQLVDDAKSTELDVSEWTFRKNEKGEYVKTRNAHNGCVEFVKKVEPVKKWLSTMVNQCVPWDWFCNELNDMGILKQRVEQSVEREIFKLLCDEYPNPSGKSSSPVIPIIPFMIIKK